MNMTTYEAIATLFGLTSTWFYIKQNNYSWPIGLVMVSMYSVLFFKVKLYAAMCLQVIFIFIQLYGWYEWVFDKAVKGHMVVFRISKLQVLYLFSFWVVFSLALAAIFYWQTDADLVLWDTANAVMCLIAQWLMARKYLESWLVWAVNDVLYLLEFTHKGLYFTAFQNAMFFILAVAGYLQWRQHCQTSSNPLPANTDWVGSLS